MKKMTKRTKQYPGSGYYRIIDCGNYYNVIIASDLANKMITYEYDAACGTIAEVEAELKASTFSEIRKKYEKECVYCECVEQIW